MKDLPKPCSDCAFRRDSKPGHLGGSQAEVYIGQCHGPFYIPCHMTYGELTSEVLENLNCTGGCAGSAVFRANLGVDGRMPAGINKLPADHDLVFSSEAEFIAHHKQISLNEAVELLTKRPPLQLLVDEINKTQVRYLNRDRSHKNR